MFSIKQLILLIRRHITQVSWAALIALLLTHAILTAILLTFAAEEALVSNSNFIYYYIVTTSTVGFGDFSPATIAGKIIVATFQIPLGLALFAAFLGKIGQTITFLLRRHMTGEKNFKHLQDHIIIFGWHPHRTPKIIDHILGDKKRQKRVILLCVKNDITHPFADNEDVEFAKLHSFTDMDELSRTAINHADRVIIDGGNDHETFTTSLRISKLVKADCHISTYFEDEIKVEMLREHCKNIECSVSRSAQMLVRSIQDPGSSRIQEELLSTLQGDTQFSVEVPAGLPSNGVNFIALFEGFKRNYNATVLGIADNSFGDGMQLNPNQDYLVRSGQTIHYIAKTRLLSHDINWNQFK
ncbi:MAG: voltage-gated potassium channel [Alteromonadaceae bacterium]|jgi:voltage-gated potassium channel